jgi:hypothetical protein
MQSITHSGQTYSLQHLAPFTRKVLLPLKGGFTKVAPIEFHFTRHCFTAGVPAGTALRSDCYWFDDGSLHKPRLLISTYS